MQLVGQISMQFNIPMALLETWTTTVHPVDGRLGTLKLRLVAPTVSAGVVVVPTQVPPI